MQSFTLRRGVGLNGTPSRQAGGGGGSMHSMLISSPLTSMERPLMEMLKRWGSQLFASRGVQSGGTTVDPSCVRLTDSLGFGVGNMN